MSEAYLPATIIWLVAGANFVPCKYCERQTVAYLHIESNMSIHFAWIQTELTASSLALGLETAVSRLKNGRSNAIVKLLSTKEE